MKRYSIPLVPGPVTIADAVRAAYQLDFGSSDLEEEFFALYSQCENGLQQLLDTKNQVTIQSGEGMLALWGALKSVLQPGIGCWPWRQDSLAMASVRWPHNWVRKWKLLALVMTASPIGSGSHSSRTVSTEADYGCALRDTQRHLESLYSHLAILVRKLTPFFMLILWPVPVGHQLMLTIAILI
ncbi:MAG: hypothetical protein R2867_01300 [Caldilineaceae bacterium]